MTGAVMKFTVRKVLTFKKIIINLYFRCSENIIFARYPSNL